MSKVRIVLADDHKLFRMGLRQLIERHPDVSIVGEAATGLEAVSIVKEHIPDVVLMDISMPELNGIEAARRLHEEVPEVRVVIVSMHSDRRYVLEALRAGVRGYLLKDSSPEEIFRAIQKVMSNQLYLSPQINEQVIAGFAQQGNAALKSAFEILSGREREVLQLLAEGKNSEQIADLLNLSAKTVETHRMHIMNKLDIHTLPELTRYALREGLTSLE
ncbi:MAG: response regulator transcription factor [bacterium]|nr:response regulator transcription factor [bacterium]